MAAVTNLRLKLQILIPEGLSLRARCDCKCPLKGGPRVGCVPQSQLETDVGQHKARLCHEALGTQLKDVFGYLDIAVVMVPLHQC